MQKKPEQKKYRFSAYLLCAQSFLCLCHRIALKYSTQRVALYFTGQNWFQPYTAVLNQIGVKYKISCGTIYRQGTILQRRLSVNGICRSSLHDIPHERNGHSFLESIIICESCIPPRNGIIAESVMCVKSIV